MDFVNEYGSLQCDCQEQEKQARKRILKDGRSAYGFQCTNCGRFETKSMKSFGWNIPTELFDANIAEQFRERRDAHWQRLRDDRDSDWKAKYEAYMQSEKWKVKRQAVLERDNYVCQGCLKNRAVQVHHLSYAHLGNEPLWDLTSVCLDCHRLVHPHMQQALVNINWDEFR